MPIFAAFGTIFSHAGSLASRIAGGPRAGASTTTPAPTTQPTHPPPPAQAAPEVKDYTQYGEGIAGAPDFQPGTYARVPARVASRFLGMNTQPDQGLLTPQEAAWAINFDGSTQRGSASVRRGLCKMSGRGSGSDAVCAVPLYMENASGKSLILIGSQGASAVTLSPVAQSIDVPKSARPLLRPLVGLSSAGGNVTIAISALVRNPGVSAVHVAWHTAGFPTSPFANEDRKTLAAQLSVTSWNGVGSFSKVVDVGVLPDATPIYVSVWLATRIAFSPVFCDTVELVNA